MRRALALLGLFVLLWAAFSLAIHQLTQNNALGSDFFIFWNAGRAAVFERANPYSDELAQQAQLAIFKRLSGPLEDQLGFAYPPYALLAIFPLLWLPFDWAQAIWIALLLLALMLAGVTALPGARRWLLPSFLLFYPTFFGSILGNFAVLISAGLLLFFGIFLRHDLPSRRMQIAFGALAGWMTVKPQFLWLFLIFISFFALRKKLWWFFLAAALSFIACIALSFALVPNWLPLWLERLSKYTGYNQAYPVLTYLLNTLLPLFAANVLTSILLVLALLITGWLFLRFWRGGQNLLAVLAWCGLVVYLFHPRGASYEHLAFLLPLLLWAAQQRNWRSLAPNLFWWGSLAASWAAFAISIQPGAPVNATEWPVLFHAVWVGWVMRSNTNNRRSLVNSSSS